jgi:hypothetical protein
MPANPEENPLNTRWLAALAFPAALVAAPAMNMSNPEMRAETWVKQSLEIAREKGADALVAEVQNPKGRFKAEDLEADPELTVYSSDLKVLAQNRASRHVGMIHAKLLDAAGASYLAKMREFAKDSGPGWFQYVGTDMNGRPKHYKAYVAFHGERLISAVVSQMVMGK